MLEHLKSRFKLSAPLKTLIQAILFTLTRGRAERRARSAHEPPEVPRGVALSLRTKTCLNEANLVRRFYAASSFLRTIKSFAHVSDCGMDFLGRERIRMTTDIQFLKNKDAAHFDSRDEIVQVQRPGPGRIEVRTAYIVSANFISVYPATLCFGTCSPRPIGVLWFFPDWYQGFESATY